MTKSEKLMIKTKQKIFVYQFDRWNYHQYFRLFLLQESLCSKCWQIEILITIHICIKLPFTP